MTPMKLPSPVTLMIRCDLKTVRLVSSPSDRKATGSDTG
jgi:hypothetical protein